MGFNRRTKKITTNVSTTTNTKIRDIGFTGQQGVDLALGLANAGQLVNAEAAETIRATGEQSLLTADNVAANVLEASVIGAGNVIEATDRFSQSSFDSLNQQRLVESNNLATIVQASSEGFNRLVGGASELVKSSEVTADKTVQTGQDQFDRIVSAARGLAGDLTQGAEAFVQGATATVERLGPQTKQNQNIAFAGIGVAALAVLFVVFAKRKS